MPGKRIYLSAPDIGKKEREYVKEAFDTNWIAPLGPNVDALEEEISNYIGNISCTVMSLLLVVLQRLGICVIKTRGILRSPSRQLAGV